MMMYKLLFCLFITCANSLPRQRPSDEGGLDLTVIHVNDIHAHFEEVSVNTTRCRAENNGDCYGGVARLAGLKNYIMEEDPEALFLNAGDFYQGDFRGPYPIKQA